MRLFPAFLLSVIWHLGLLLLLHGLLVRGSSVYDPTPQSTGGLAAISVRLGEAPGRTSVEISKREPPRSDSQKKAKPVSTESITEGNAIASVPLLSGTQSFHIPPAYYFGPDELTQRPAIASDFSLEVDEVTMNPGSGAMILTLFVSDSGKVDSVEFESGEIDPGLRDVLLRRFSEAEFTPGERGGVQVRSRIKIEVVVAPTLTQ